MLNARVNARANGREFRILGGDKKNYTSVSVSLEHKNSTENEVLG